MSSFAGGIKKRYLLLSSSSPADAKYSLHRTHYMALSFLRKRQRDGNLYALRR